MGMNLPPLILASASRRRSELVRQLGMEFNVMPSSAPEIEHDQLTSREIAQINAYRKARAVAKKCPDALVLGADTLVAMERTMFGKPSDLEQAYRMLESLQGRSHEVVTAICLLQLRSHRQRLFSERTVVTSRPLHAFGIRRYLNQVNPLDKAGAYPIHEKGGLFVESTSPPLPNARRVPLY